MTGTTGAILPEAGYPAAARYLWFRAAAFYARNALRTGLILLEGEYNIERLHLGTLLESRRKRNN